MPLFLRMSVAATRKLRRVQGGNLLAVALSSLSSRRNSVFHHSLKRRTFDVFKTCFTN
jgi:hypothetical protein